MSQSRCPSALDTFTAAQHGTLQELLDKAPKGKGGAEPEGYLDSSDQVHSHASWGSN